MDYVAPIDLLATLLFTAALACSFRIRSPLIDRTSRIFLHLSLGIYVLVGIFNVLQHGGVTSYLEVLDSQRTSFNVGLELSQVEQTYLNAYVKLYKALGGGWDIERGLYQAEDLPED